MLGFLKGGFWRSKWGPHACTAGSSPPEPPPHTHIATLKRFYPSDPQCGVLCLHAASQFIRSHRRQPCHRSLHLWHVSYSWLQITVKRRKPRGCSSGHAEYAKLLSMKHTSYSHTVTASFSGLKISCSFPILNWPWKTIHAINCPRNWSTITTKTTSQILPQTKNEIKQTHLITKWIKSLTNSRNENKQHGLGWWNRAGFEDGIHQAWEFEEDSVSKRASHHFQVLFLPSHKLSRVSQHPLSFDSPERVHRASETALFISAQTLAHGGTLLSTDHALYPTAVTLDPSGATKCMLQAARILRNHCGEGALSEWSNYNPD